MKLKDALDLNRGVGPGFHWLRHALAIGIIAHHCRAAIYMSVTAAALRAEGIATQAITTSPTLTLDNALRPALFSLVGMFLL